MDSQNTPASAPPTRRGFMEIAIVAMNALIGAALAIPAVLYLVVPSHGRKRSPWTDAGDLSGLAPGKPKELEFMRRRVDGWKASTEKSTAWVVREANGQLVAFAPMCTHLGCAYHFDDGKDQFVCPCHGSYFSIDGKVISGPAPRPLDRYAVKLEGTRIWLGPLEKSNEERA
jgi:menaquinol-cytochrome c reductase iron-sulfur subunit